MDWETLILNVLGGIAFFLYGMQLLTDSMKLVLGDRFKHWLTQLTSNRVSGLILGAALTIACQSSSITTVLTIGLVSADIMPFEHSIGVTLGANIGSTVTGQLISFSITKYYTAIVFVAGVMMAMGSGSSRATGTKASRLRSLSLFGSTLMGLAFIFLGMEVLSVGAKSLKNEKSFTDALARLDNRGVAMLVGLGITSVIQSSGMMSAIIITLANQGLIPLEVGMAIMVGANVGSCVPAMLACMNQNRVAQQTALAHLMFNVILVVIWTPLLPFMIDFVQLFPPHVDASIEGEQAKRETEYPRQIANSHTFDNLSIVLLLLPFTKQFAHLIQWMRPLEPKEASTKVMDGTTTVSPTGKLSVDDEEKLWQSDTTTGAGETLISESSNLPDLHPKYLSDNYLDSVSIELGLHVLVREMERFALRIGDAFQLCTQSLLHAYIHAQMEHEEQLQAQKRQSTQTTGGGEGVEVVLARQRSHSRSGNGNGKRSRSSSKDGWSAVFSSHAGRQLAVYSSWASDLWRYLAAIRSFHSSLVGSFGLLTEMQTSQLVRWGSLLQSFESAVQTIHQLIQSAHLFQSSPVHASRDELNKQGAASESEASASPSITSMIPSSLYDLVSIVSQSWKDVAELLEVQVQEGIKKHKKKSDDAISETARVTESTQTDTGSALTQVSVEVPNIDSTSPSARILAASASVSRLVKATSAACSGSGGSGGTERSEGEKPLFPFPVRIARSLKSFYFSAWHIANTLGMSPELSMQSFDMWEQPRETDEPPLIPSTHTKNSFPQVVQTVIKANKVDKEKNQKEQQQQTLRMKETTPAISTSTDSSSDTVIQLTPLQMPNILPNTEPVLANVTHVGSITPKNTTSAPLHAIELSQNAAAVASASESNIVFHINDSLSQQLEYSSMMEQQAIKLEV